MKPLLFDHCTHMVMATAVFCQRFILFAFGFVGCKTFPCAFTAVNLQLNSAVYYAQTLLFVQVLNFH